MDYSLAKELKDAGFPQELPNPSSYWAGATTKRLFGWSEGEDQPYGDYVKQPTLEELIDACRKDLYELKYGREGEPDIWFTNTDFNGVNDLFDYYQSRGGTASIAVANLWLALNKKA